jgi:SPP1 family predicted phage head-tail adaptor
MMSGDLRHYVTIKKPYNSDTWGTGQFFLTFCSLYADIKPANGSRNFEANQNNAKITHEIKTRFVPGLLPSFRIIDDNGKTYRIESIIDVGERQRELKIQCVEEVARASISV